MWTCRIYPFKPPAMWTWRVYSSPSPAVWTWRVYLSPPSAVYSFRVYQQGREIINVRGQSYVLRLPKYWPTAPTPLTARRVCSVPPAFVAGGGHTRRVKREVGGQNFGRRKIQLCTLPISNPLWSAVYKYRGCIPPLRLRCCMSCRVYLSTLSAV